MVTSVVCCSLWPPYSLSPRHVHRRWRRGGCSLGTAKWFRHRILRAL